MKKIILIVLAIFSLTSSTSDDDSINEIAYKENVTFEITSTGYSSTIAYMTINDSTEKAEIESFSYRNIYEQQSLKRDTKFKFVLANNNINSTLYEDPSWTDYYVELKIKVGYKTIRKETFLIKENIESVKMELTLPIIDL